jgi:hypothetical protein
MSQYKAGSVTLIENSPVVSGSGTEFLTYVKSGDIFIRRGGQPFVINSVNSDTELTLTANYTKLSESDAPYVIHVDFTSFGMPLMQNGDLETVVIFNRSMMILNDLGVLHSSNAALAAELQEMLDLAIEVVDVKFTKLVDEDGAMLYLGEATPATLSTDAAWRIMRIDSSAYPDISVKYALGANNMIGFQHAWDDRLSLTYG